MSKIIELSPLIWQGLGETLYMVVVSTFIAYLIGLPLGVILVATDKNGIRPMPVLNTVLQVIINFLRSIPFLILLILLMPFTRIVVGTSIGSTATIVPLVVGSAPFIARVVESSLKEVDRGVIEAAQSMGASNFKIIYKVLIPEAKPSLILGAAITITTILSYSAMAGACAGGGLGDLAIKYGYHRYQGDVMFIIVIILVLLVQLFQEVGARLAKLLDNRL